MLLLLLIGTDKESQHTRRHLCGIGFRRATHACIITPVPGLRSVSPPIKIQLERPNAIVSTRPPNWLSFVTQFSPGIHLHSWPDRYGYPVLFCYRISRVVSGIYRSVGVSRRNDTATGHHHHLLAFPVCSQLARDDDMSL